MKLPPAVRTNKILRTLPDMEGVHVAPVPGVVTAHAGLPPRVIDPESVIRMAELTEDTMALEGVNAIEAVVEEPCN